MMAYNLRGGQKKNYKQLSDTKLPRASRRSAKHEDDDQLYSVEITEEREDQVKIHYIGYSSKHDEWRKKEDIVQPSTINRPERYQPFDIHQQLVYAVKASLVSYRYKDPAVRIEVPFDWLMFQGGLKNVGQFVREVRGEVHYTIQDYDDLVPFLEERYIVYQGH